VNDRRNDPSVDGARTPPNSAPIARAAAGAGWAARPGRAASLRTRRAPLSAPGSPAIHAARVTGFAWM
jgi:hypothetical protein